MNISISLKNFIWFLPDYQLKINLKDLYWEKTFFCELRLYDSVNSKNDCRLWNWRNIDLRTQKWKRNELYSSLENVIKDIKELCDSNNLVITKINIEAYKNQNKNSITILPEDFLITDIKDWMVIDVITEKTYKN